MGHYQVLLGSILLASLSLLAGCCELFGLFCPRPDLTVQSLRLEPRPPVEYGQPLEVYADVVNRGGKASGLFRVAFLIDGREFDSVFLESIPPGEMATAHGVLDTAKLRSERYEICVFVDADDDVREKEEGNNLYCESVGPIVPPPEPLFVVTPGGNIQYLEQIDPETGEIIDSLRLKLPHGIERIRSYTIAFSPDGKLYGIDKDRDRLYTINPETGEVKFISRNDGDLRPPGVKDVGTAGMAFDKEGRLFAIDLKNDILYQIDLVTGKGIKVIGSLGIDVKDHGMAVDFETGKLYAVIGKKDGIPDKLLKIDKETGKATVIGSLDLDCEDVAVEFDPVTGRLYTIREGDDLYEVDIKTGKAILLWKDLLIDTAAMAAKWPNRYHYSAPIASEWRWPTDNPSVAQDYGVPNPEAGNKLHTGIDVIDSTVTCPEGAVGGCSAVFAAAAGLVIAVCPDGSACPGFSTTSDNHNMQGVVIIRHILPDERIIYSLYAHLGRIEGDLQVGQLVEVGTPLGTTGVYLRNGRWVSHVHFELKDEALLHNPKGGDACVYDGTSGPCWGYTPGDPDDYGYHDPKDYLK